MKSFDDGSLSLCLYRSVIRAVVHGAQCVSIPLMMEQLVADYGEEGKIWVNYHT